MNKRGRNLLWASVGLLVLALPVALLLLGPHEPRYQGKRLRSWTVEFDGSAGPKWQEAEEAVRCIGTNGLPYIAAMLRAKDTPFQLWTSALLSKQSLIKIRFVNAQTRRARGLFACGALGTNARPIIPAISALVYDRELSRHAATVLTGFGPEVIPTLTIAASHADPKVRYGAIAPLGRLQDQSTVPILLKCTQDPDANVRAFAIEVLAVVAKDPDVAIPALLTSIQDASPQVRGVASGRLELWVQYPQAKAAVPLLLKEVRDTAQSTPSDVYEYNLHRNAGRTLRKLDPAAADAAGVLQE